MDIKKEHGTILQDLANTMLSVARESVTLIKRSDQAISTKFTREQEWEIYLEFIKVMFNLADRISAFYIPIQQQPQFMDSLEDNVSDQLTTLLAPSMSSSEIDNQEVILSIGQAVGESRKIYEKYKFVFSEDTKERNAFFQHAAERVAGRAGASNNPAIMAASTLCTSAIIPAMQALFEGKTEGDLGPSTSSKTEKAAGPASSEPTEAGPQAIKLVSVVSSIAGEEFETRWGFFPQFRRDLPPEELKELTTHLNRVSQIIGDRFALLSSKLPQDSTQPSGQA
jgi:hypothetical protein